MESEGRALDGTSAAGRKAYGVIELLHPSALEFAQIAAVTFAVRVALGLRRPLAG